MSVPTETWVSKTDLTRFLRCPYAFYLVDRGLVAFEDTVNDLQLQLIHEGIRFQENIEATLPVRKITPEDLPTVFADESIRLFGAPLLRNAALQICGQPDAIDTANGELVPVEVKSHQDVQRSDELELAFYWLLLEPYRTRPGSPRGSLILRRQGVPTPVDVLLKPDRFEQVRDLIRDIRTTRVQGVAPRICGCTVCSGVMRDEIMRVTRDKKDLTMIWGIARAYARHLEAIGVTNYEDLLGADSASVVASLRERRCFVSIAHVDSWKHHATSYATSQPVVFGGPLALNDSFIALDLEYLASDTIWLVGLCIVTQGGRYYRALWAESAAEEEANLREVAAILAANASLPVITWSGNGADLPQVKYAAKRLALDHAYAAIESRHVDLYQYTRKALRFPIPRLSLDEVGQYFGIPKVSRITGGLEAQSLYLEYRRSQAEERRAAIKSQLMEYNRDDIEALVGVAEALASLGRRGQC
jgi:predicted RecB family nuclease